MKRKEKKKGYIVLGKGTMVRKRIYRRKRKQKGGVYFADRVLKRAEIFFKKEKDLRSK